MQDPDSESHTVISIHAPTRGATNRILQRQYMKTISIHAPTRGATFCFLGFLFFLSDFNPRSYKRSDPFSGSTVNFCNDFNPRSYKRSDT